MSKCKAEGVLVGITICEHDQPHIAVDVGGNRIDLPIQIAAVLYFQIGELLETVGYFNDDDGDKRVLN